MANNEPKFTASARIPTRPLSYESVALAENKELIADYENHELYIKDADGNVVNVTASVTTVIEEVREEMEKDPTIITDVKIELPDGSHVTLQKSIYDLYNKFTALEKKIDDLGVEVDEVSGKVTMDAGSIKTDEEHQFVTATEKETWNKKTDTIQLNVGIKAKAANWTGDEAPYKQTINVTDIKETDYPVVDVVLSSDYKTAMDELSNYAYIYKILTFDGYIEVYSIKPTEVALTIVMKIDR